MVCCCVIAEVWGPVHTAESLSIHWASGVRSGLLSCRGASSTDVLVDETYVGRRERADAGHAAFLVGAVAEQVARRRDAVLPVVQCVFTSGLR
jgi:hypothetical protein